MPERVDFSTLGDLYNTFMGARQERDIISGRRRAEESLNTGDTRGAIARLIGSGDVQGARALVEHWNAQNGVFGTPIYGVVNGKPAIGTFDKSGGFRPINTGNFEVTPGVKTIDTGTGTAVVSSKSGTPVGGAYQPGTAAPGQPQQPAGYIEKDVAGEAEQKKLGAEQGEKLSQLGAKKQALGSTLYNLTEFSKLAREAASHPGLSGITGIQGVFPNWPGGNAANAQAKASAIGNRASITTLQAMREASKTGGAIGQVTEREYPILESQISELDRKQGTAEYRAALLKVARYADELAKRVQEAYDTDFADLRRPSPQQSGRAPIPRPGGMKTINGKNYIKIGNDWYEQ